jgi:pimeloyl-ACP methyl ester carboxylesterase
MRAVTYRKVDVDGTEVFYREAGPKDAPTILLLHGFPTAGHMFRDLVPMSEWAAYSRGNDCAPR